MPAPRTFRETRPVIAIALQFGRLQKITPAAIRDAGLHGRTADERTSHAAIGPVDGPAACLGTEGGGMTADSGTRRKNVT